MPWSYPTGMLRSYRASTQNQLYLAYYTLLTFYVSMILNGCSLLTGSNYGIRTTRLASSSLERFRPPSLAAYRRPPLSPAKRVVSVPHRVPGRMKDLQAPVWVAPYHGINVRTGR
jgi:hypothetical protein